MDRNIIENWNDTVNQNDYIYILGDISFANAEQTEHILQQLNGTKILIYGNHDRVIRTNKNLQTYFTEIHEFLERDFIVDNKKHKIVMCHYALKVWNKSHHGSLHLYGHSHGTLPDDGTRSMDIGMDCHNMRPINLENIFNKIGKRELKQLTNRELK